MQYKTIVLDLIQERPHLHQQLQESRMLLVTVEQYARALRAIHQRFQQELMETGSSDPAQIPSQAMELALEAFTAHLSPESTDPALTLDAAMAFIQRHTPHA